MIDRPTPGQKLPVERTILGSTVPRIHDRTGFHDNGPRRHTRRDNGGPVFARFIVMPGYYRRPRRYLECYRFSYIRALWVAIVSTTIVDTRTPERISTDRSKIRYLIEKYQNIFL